MYYTKKNTFHNIITLAAEFTKCFFFPTHTYCFILYILMKVRQWNISGCLKTFTVKQEHISTCTHSVLQY